MNDKNSPDLQQPIPQTMAPFGPWAGLPPELLLLIGNGFGLSLESYCHVRGVCTTWRSALPPPTPSLLTVSAVTAASTNCRHTMRGVLNPTAPPPAVSILLLPAESASFNLGTLPHGTRCVGSSNGWMAVISCNQWQSSVFLSNPLAGGKKIPLPTLRQRRGEMVTKIVFAPNPTLSDYVAVMICGVSSLAYAKARDLAWTTIDVAMERGEHLVDLAYHDDGDDGGKVYCVTVNGDVRVLRLPSRLRQNPVMETLDVERAGLPFGPAAAYAPPYDVAYKFTGFKRIFFVGGSVYQLWRNTTSAVSWATQGGGRFRMARDQVFVLKYDPERRPCWDAASDLGGYVVFVGKNNPVVMRPEPAAEVRANCVYWIGERSRNAPMVFDVITGASTLHPSAARAFSFTPSSRPVCWYFLHENNIMSGVEENGRKRLISGEDCEQQESKSQKTH